MAFTLATLKTAIQDYTQNDETTFVNNLDVMIKQAEERINLAVQVANYNTKVETGQTADHDSSVVIAGTGPGVVLSNETSPVSPLYFKVREGNATTANPWQFLLLKDYNFLQEYAPISDNTTDGTPKYYSFYNDASNDGLATFPISPTADGIYDYEILYLFRPSSLITDSSGTWLSTHGETALLYGCLVEAYTFMKGDNDLLQLYDTRFKEGLQLLVFSQQGSFRNSTYRDNVGRPMAAQPGAA